MRQPLLLSFSPTSTAVTLFGVTFALGALHVLVMFVHYRVMELSHLIRNLFDLDEERSLGTWFSSAQLLACGVILLAIARSTPKGGPTGKPYWKYLGLGFCLLSLDEVAGLHEKYNTITEFSWAIPGLILALLSALAFAPFIIFLPKRTRWLMVIAGTIYVGGAIGVELAGGWFTANKLLNTLEYNLTTALEEVMEMSGVAMMIYALLDYIATTRRQVEFGLTTLARSEKFERRRTPVVLENR